LLFLFPTNCTFALHSVALVAATIGVECCNYCFALVRCHSELAASRPSTGRWIANVEEKISNCSHKHKNTTSALPITRQHSHRRNGSTTDCTGNAFFCHNAKALAQS
jgi:hypothetical protein